MAPPIRNRRRHFFALDRSNVGPSRRYRARLNGVTPTARGSLIAMEGGHDMKPSAVMLAVGTALYFYGASALALPQSYAPHMPDYQAWLQIALGLLTAVIGAYAKGVSDRVTENKREIDVLRQALNLTQVSIATEHHTKAEANEHFNKLEASVNAVHRRLDYMRVPSSFGLGGMDA